MFNFTSFQVAFHCYSKVQWNVKHKNLILYLRFFLYLKIFNGIKKLKIALTQFVNSEWNVRTRETRLAIQTGWWPDSTSNARRVYYIQVTQQEKLSIPFLISFWWWFFSAFYKNESDFLHQFFVSFQFNLKSVCVSMHVRPKFISVWTFDEQKGERKWNHCEPSKNINSQKFWFISFYLSDKKDFSLHFLVKSHFTYYLTYSKKKIRM